MIAVAVCLSHPNHHYRLPIFIMGIIFNKISSCISSFLFFFVFYEKATNISFFWVIRLPQKISISTIFSNLILRYNKFCTRICFFFFVVLVFSFIYFIFAMGIYWICDFLAVRTQVKKFSYTRQPPSRKVKPKSI